MTTHYRTKAFVFKKNDVNESDRVFSVFADNFGRLDIFAKAIRKSASKLRGGIDIFFMSEIEFIQGKNRKTLIDASLIKKFNFINCDLGKFKITNKIGEILDNFIKGEEKDKEIFNLLSEVMDKLNSQNISKGVITYYYFLWRVLLLLGYCPEVNKCNICQEKLNPNSVYFSEKLGGAICKKCLSHDFKAVIINPDVIKLLRLILRNELDILFKLKVDKLSQQLFQKISDNYYAYILSSHSFKNILRIAI